MFYHIYIEYYINDLKKPIKEECYEKNITNLDDIKKNYVNPFLKGKIFFVNGRVIRPNTVNIFKVLKSEKSLDQLLEEKNNSIPSGVIMWYRSENLLSGHFDGLTDITNDIINEINWTYLRKTVSNCFILKLVDFSNCH